LFNLFFKIIKLSGSANDSVKIKDGRQIVAVDSAMAAPLSKQAANIRSAKDSHSFIGRPLIHFVTRRPIIAFKSTSIGHFLASGRQSRSIHFRAVQFRPITDIGRRRFV
jgi:hypothetical protein